VRPLHLCNHAAHQFRHVVGEFAKFRGGLLEQRARAGIGLFIEGRPQAHRLAAAEHLDQSGHGLVGCRAQVLGGALGHFGVVRSPAGAAPGRLLGRNCPTMASRMEV
jgi:hypothetical protein